MYNKLLLLSFALISPLALGGEEMPVVKLTVKNGYFTPSTIEAPSNVKFKLLVTNEGSSAEEFESTELNREKIIAAGKTVTVFLGPLPAGSYGFFGEFNPKTAQGKLIIR